MPKVCLDAGHYGNYNRSPGVPAYYEGAQMWKLTQLLAAELQKRGISVIQTRTNQATDLALTSRGKMAKGCDLFVSLHSNAVGSSMNESVDYPLAVVMLNGSTDKIGKDLAACVATAIGTKQKGKTTTKAGSTGGEYYGVLRGAAAVGVPGLILEHSFHTNTKAANWLLSDANLTKLAEAEAECIASYLQKKKPAKQEAPKKEAAKPATFKSYLVKITASTLNVRAGAGTHYKINTVVQKGGVYTIVDESNGWGKLKSGAGWINLSYTQKLR